MEQKIVVIEFTKVDLPYGWLGNMFASPIKYEGQEWRTSEALFQALRYDVSAIRELIRNEKSPMGAKMQAKKYKAQMKIAPMSDEDIALMKGVVRIKFAQNEVLKEKLKRTGKHTLVENILNRKGERHLFWGMKKENGTWVGNNNMGKILMEIRSELIEGI